MHDHNQIPATLYVEKYQLRYGHSQVVTLRLQYEAKQCASGKRVPQFVEKETRALAKVHDVFEDLIINQHRLLLKHSVLLENEALHNTIDLLDYKGLLPPINGAFAQCMGTIQKSINCIRDRRHQNAQAVSKGESHD